MTPFINIVLLLQLGVFIPSCSNTTKSKEAPVDKMRQEITAAHQESAGDFEPIPLPQLIGIAEYSVIGSVTSMTDTSFWFEINEGLIGNLSSNRIEVKKYVPNKFDGPRAAEYAVGQTFLLFLKYDNQNKIYTIYGLGGEGELPINNNFVYFHGRTVEGIAYAQAKIHGVERRIQKYDRQKFKAALSAYRKCYIYLYDKKIKKYSVNKSCSEEAIDAQKSIDFMHQYLIEHTVMKQ